MATCPLLQPCPTQGMRHGPGTLDPPGVHQKRAQSLSAHSFAAVPLPKQTGKEALMHFYQGQTYGNELRSMCIQNASLTEGQGVPFNG